MIYRVLALVTFLFACLSTRIHSSEAAYWTAFFAGVAIIAFMIERDQ